MLVIIKLNTKTTVPSDNRGRGPTISEARPTGAPFVEVRTALDRG